ncbi:hypothetical protein AVEN_217896-1 [Araneus ventricosus]|uniref:Uncharacterized protein n=1 Tax=Araneus ventricosus TaxID=182803 RepID=A0A4Y2EIA0_ARAVE|nr:hypothetical protein AVEN_217896-1 [Araneus ventricosus]
MNHPGTQPVRVPPSSHPFSTKSTTKPVSSQATSILPFPPVSIKEVNCTSPGHNRIIQYRNLTMGKIRLVRTGPHPFAFFRKEKNLSPMEGQGGRQKRRKNKKSYLPLPPRPSVTPSAGVKKYKKNPH